VDVGSLSLFLLWLLLTLGMREVLLPLRQTRTRLQLRSQTTASLRQHRSVTEEDLADDDLDPAAFLKSVRELSEKREREDNERYRKLEEEIALGRQERLARRKGMHNVRYDGAKWVKADGELLQSARNQSHQRNNHNNKAHPPHHVYRRKHRAAPLPLLARPDQPRRQHLH